MKQTVISSEMSGYVIPSNMWAVIPSKMSGHVIPSECSESRNLTLANAEIPRLHFAALRSTRNDD